MHRSGIEDPDEDGELVQQPNVQIGHVSDSYTGYHPT